LRTLAEGNRRLVQRTIDQAQTIQALQRTIDHAQKAALPNDASESAGQNDPMTDNKALNVAQSDTDDFQAAATPQSETLGSCA
jgi:hypothetical protein